MWGSKKVSLSILFIATLSIYSCSTAKKAGNNNPNEIVKADKEVKETPIVPESPKDSTRIVVVPEDKTTEEVKPKEVEVPNTRPVESKKIALFLPYGEDNERYMQFYGGVKLALEELEYENQNLEVEVMEARKNTDLSTLDLSGFDLVFAPNDEAQIKWLIDNTRNTKTRVVSSWFSMSNVQNSPHYLQLKPSLKAHFRAILQHISEHYNLKDVVIVARNTKTDQNWLKYFQAEAERLFQAGMVKPITEHYVLDDSITFGSSVFVHDIFVKHKKVFIIPNYSYKDENYLTGVLRRLNAEKAENKITVYGMPILKDSEQMDFETLKNLHVRVPSSKWTDPENEDLKSFNLKFYDKYGSLASPEALEGFDNFLFVARNLSKLEKPDFDGMTTENFYIHTNYEVGPSIDDTEPENIDFYENRHLDILEFNGKIFDKIP